MRNCQVEGCNNNYHAKGYCQIHYDKVKYHGSVDVATMNDPNEIIEANGYFEIILRNKKCEEVARSKVNIDDIDKVKQHKWHLERKQGYVRSSNGIMLHRLIMNAGDDYVVDHISHDKLDNRKSNLRLVTPSQNCMNKVIIKSNTSGVTGVYYNNKANKWAAQIWINGRSKNLGTFINKSDAITARHNAEVKYFGEYQYKRSCLS